MSDRYELTSLRSRSPQQSTRSRPFLVAQTWYMRVPATVRAACASWTLRTTRYTLISDIEGTDNHGRDAIHTRIRPPFSSIGRLRFRRLIWVLFVALPSLAVVVILLVAVFHPSYSHPPHHYNILRSRALQSTHPGRINVHQEKVFIVSSIYDEQGRLTSGSWAQNLLDLVDLLGPENVFLSIFEDDPDNMARSSLERLFKQVKCGSTQVVPTHHS
jgi:hypothetical protein